MESIDRGFPNSQLIIRFEDLIYDHKNTKRILDFLEMDLGHEDSRKVIQSKIKHEKYIYLEKI